MSIEYKGITLGNRLCVKVFCSDPRSVETEINHWLQTEDIAHVVDTNQSSHAIHGAGNTVAVITIYYVPGSGKSV